MSAKPAAKRSGAKAAERTVVTAAFALSWDGRVIERRVAARGVEAVLGDEEGCGAAKKAMRVLVDATGRVDLNEGYLKGGISRVVIYSTTRMAKATQAALAAMDHVEVHLHPAGKWPLQEVLEHLRGTHGVGRLALACGPELFREFAVSGLLDELRIAWQPCVVGGKSAPPITGMSAEFLPKGIVLDLLKLARKGDEYLATYRVHGTR